MSEVTREYLSQFRVLDLQEHCNNLGLTQTGSKDELIENIFQHHQSRILQVRKLLNRYKAASEKAQLTEKGRGPRPSTSTTLPGITPITPRLGVDSEPEDEFILLPGKLSSADPSVDEAEASADEQAAHDDQDIMLLTDHSTNQDNTRTKLKSLKNLFLLTIQHPVRNPSNVHTQLQEILFDINELNSSLLDFSAKAELRALKVSMKYEIRKADSMARLNIEPTRSASPYSTRSGHLYDSLQSLPGITPITPRVGVDSQPKNEVILMLGDLSSSEVSVDDAGGSAHEQEAHSVQDVMQPTGTISNKHSVANHSIAQINSSSMHRLQSPVKAVQSQARFREASLTRATEENHQFHEAMRNLSSRLGPGLNTDNILTSGGLHAQYRLTARPPDLNNVPAPEKNQLCSQVPVLKESMHYRSLQHRARAQVLVLQENMPRASQHQPQPQEYDEDHLEVNNSLDDAHPPASLPGSEDLPFYPRKYSSKERRCMKMIQDTANMITEIMDINIELMSHTELLEFSYYEEKRCTTYYQAFTNAVREYDNLDLDDPVCNQIISNMETQSLKYFKRLVTVKKKHSMPLKPGDNFFKKVDLSLFSGDITGDTSYEYLDVSCKSADTTTTPIICLDRIVNQNETGIHNPQTHYEDNIGLDISTEKGYGICVLLQDSVADYTEAYEPGILPQGSAMNSLEDVKGPCVLLQDSVADYPEAYESAILTQGNSIEDVMGPCVLLQDSVADCPDVNEPGTLPQGRFLNCPGEDYASSVLQQGSTLNCLKEDCRLSILPQGSVHNCLQEVYASMVLLQDSNLNCLDEDNRHCVQQQGGLENYPKEDYEPCVSPQGSVVDCPDKGYGPFLLPNGIKEADGPCVQQGSGGNFHNVDNGPCALLQSKALNYQREDNGPRVLWQGNTLNCLEDMSCVKPQGSVRNPPREDKGPCVLQQGQENCLKEDCGSFVPTQGSAIDFPKIDYWSRVLLQGAAHRCLQEVYVPSVQLQDKSVIYKLFLFLCNSSKVRGVQEETKDIPSDTSVGCVSHQYIQQEDVALLQWLCKDSVLQDARNEGGGILLL